MIPARGYQGRRVGVLGLGRSGLAAARALAAGGAQPVCWDDAEPARAAAAAEGFELGDLTREGAAWEGLAALIVSPGIPHLHPAPHRAVEIAFARGVAVDNDVGLFFRSAATEDWAAFDSPPRIVCVTGSNGKSTTTALIAHILRRAGRKAQMGGNIGRGVLDLDPLEDGETVVLELSSYQIELARALAPDVAVFLNLSPDHLDRHGGMGGYFAAKARLFELGGPERAVIGVDQPEGRFLANRMRENEGDGAPVIAVSARRVEDAGWSVTFRKGFVAERRGGRQVAAVDLRPARALRGAHNWQNAACAYAACRALGLSPRAIEAGLMDFPGLPHRLETVGEAGGVPFVNDSKATNADAAEKALSAFERVRWIAGGVPKEGGIAPLAPLFGRVAKAYLIGQAAPEFAAQLGEVPHEICGDLETAFALAAQEARPGEAVLLAPACASFDQFRDFEARGDAFRALARAWIARHDGRLAAADEEDAR
ncbi:UDP-N-acetylmuramoyl-L-alanine--D-glutamate ligase [Oceanicella actignis]|uniref:UDP-N-acetylmuramoyl-L-alanine--D-glutamate ligase n=1 Tax=Oceanicella actignis TaxID=1189325 RepID=UPI0011E7155C|nr:UDP-N-acetylmuramoyl-L-alanine--D-glutamate ligase [Oceanicella actignis]TYO91530.1 UDP-N-acetylmuramoylalanine--D-glutamate ligase [Oceanicella actignis]